MIVMKINRVTSKLVTTKRNLGIQMDLLRLIFSKSL